MASDHRHETSDLIRRTQDKPEEMILYYRTSSPQSQIHSGEFDWKMYTLPTVFSECRFNVHVPYVNVH